MKKIKKTLYKFSIVIFAIVVFWIVLAIIPPRKVIVDNPFIVEKNKGPMIAAHRGGKYLNPENTFLAFDNAIQNYDIDILELDLCMTKDQKLVAIHDLTVNNLCDAVEVTGENRDHYVNEYTLDELLNFNFGYRFKAKDNTFPYQNLVEINQSNRKEIIKSAKLSIVTIDEIFEAYYQTDLLFIVEIKNKDAIGKKAADILYDLITDNIKFPNSNLINRVVIGTFHDEIENYLKTTYPSLLRGGSVGEVTKFVLTQMFGVNIFNKSSFVCLQIPPQQKAFNMIIKLDRLTYIKRAHRRNIAVQYWTINDEETMRQLIKMGVDAIMTDDPDLLYQVLQEMGYRN